MHPKLLLLDLDGTVYRGDDPIPEAAETIRAARAAGHDVTLVAGPVALRTPAGVRRIDVVSARDMLAAVEREDFDAFTAARPLAGVELLKFIGVNLVRNIRKENENLALVYQALIEEIEGR